MVVVNQVDQTLKEEILQTFENSMLNDEPFAKPSFSLGTCA